MLTVRYRVVQSEALSDDASGRHSCFTTSTAALLLIAELADIESFNLRHSDDASAHAHFFGSLMRETRASCGFEQAGCVAFHINI